MISATYSPEDNKLRLYPSSRLDAETYARVKAAGFSWAPKQELFVAPMWTPKREDLAIELAGEIGDEDTSLVERAEERAERFAEYRKSRTEDAESARRSVAAIADNIPLGQPILVGHHSEKHARRDAERIENGMRRAVKMWETAQYWQSRAKGAIRAAKYKERPDVRTRRIKGLESDLRKQQRNAENCAKALKIWSDPLAYVRRKDGEPLSFHDAVAYIAGRTNTAGYDVYSDFSGGKITAEEAQARVLAAWNAYAEPCARWAAHYTNRIAYERAMLDASGGTVAERTGPEKGGACRCWASPGRGWSYIQKVNKVSVTVLDNWGNGGANFIRTIPLDKLHAIMTAAEVGAARAEGRLVEVEDKRGFFLRDTPPRTAREPEQDSEQAAAFAALREQAKAGVQVAVAPQLFPTPLDIAARMVELAEIEPGARVLEPSAGTGRLLSAMGGRMFGHEPERGEVVAVEFIQSLADRLRREFPLTDVRCSDFLACNSDLGMFDRIIMNPPFVDGADVKHIRHALSFLRPGGRLVALCADGPRQRETLQGLAGSWESLPAGSFKESGTMVNVALITVQT